jgi:hypothetical protein
MIRLSRPLLAVAPLSALLLGGAACKKSQPAPPVPLAGGADSLRDPGPPVDSGSACPDRNPLKNVYFGDLHVHTGYSLDAYAVATRSDPRDAYRFARGQSPVHIASAAKSPGPEVKIDRPLQFAVVTDHSEFFGASATCTLDPSNERYDQPYCRALRDQGSTQDKIATYATLFQLARMQPADALICKGTSERAAGCEAGRRTVWKTIQEAANAAYERCRFTTFKGYEWSAQSGLANLHRNVIFSGDKVPEAPFDFIRYPTAVELWRALARECRAEEGCDALTIPHNSNSSAGQMWETMDDPQAVPLMQRYQTLVEIFQHKGSSECAPGQALGDDGCQFEYIAGSAVLKALGLEGDDPKATQRNAAAYVRNGLGSGLSYAARQKQNPLALGFTASTDTHNAAPGSVREDSWPGHTGGADATPAGRLKSISFNPGGVTGVWAEQNSRESIFAALKRRETYATSGPRLVVRLYVLPDATEEAARSQCKDPLFPKGLVDAGAVPMGGIFYSKSGPVVVVSALKDETPLAQIDLIKVSADAAGKPVLSVKKLALEGTDQHKACVVFSDPDFKPGQPTLYYARVLEQPTWRWSHKDCAADPAAAPEVCKSAGVDIKIQERAWTSPVFSKL